MMALVAGRCDLWLHEFAAAVARDNVCSPCNSTRKRVSCPAGLRLLANFARLERHLPAIND
jgi:hypothetical protein